MRQRQRGIALITAMLIVAIVATVATYLSLGQTVWLRQTQNFADLAQADAAATAGFNAAAVLLAAEAKKNTATDHLGEDWAKPLPAFPFENGALQVTVTDAQARFNLNNLAVNKNDQNFQKSGRVFRELLKSVGLEQELIYTLIDWLDADDEGPAEDNTYYLTLPMPYRAANGKLASIDELRLIKGFTPEAVAKLRPLVTVFPNTTSVNINTAPPEVISAMFNPSPGLAAVQQMISGREKTPFDGCNDSRFGGQTLPICDVKTRFFEVVIDAQFGRLRRRTLGLIERDNKSAAAKWQRQYLVNELKPATQE